MQAMSGINNSISNIQIVRFLAAAMVLIGHLEHEVVKDGVGNAENFHELGFMFWGGGVDIFFVVSGFIMYLLSRDRFGKEGAAADFLARRMIRVAPMYWLFTLLMLVAMVIFPHNVNHSTLMWDHILASLAFLPYPNEFGKLNPVLGVGWTLEYEVFFYLIFALGLIMPAKRGLAFIGGFFLLLVILRPVTANAGYLIEFLSRPIILEFLFGILVAALYAANVRISGGLALGLLVTGLAWLSLAQYLGWTDQETRVFGAGLPAVLIVSAAALGPALPLASKTVRGLVLAGDASYSLYLSHAFSLNFIALFWKRAGLGEPLLYVTVSAIAAIVSSIVIYLYFEKPLTEYLKSVYEARRAGKAKALAIETS